jgi:ABC-2 type transport system permease protein
VSLILLRQHLRQERGALIGWTLTVSVLAFAMAALFSLIPASFATQVKPFMGRLPGGITSFLGGPATFTSAAHWVAGMSLESFIPLAVAIFVALSALSLVVEDRDAGSLEFLLALPVTRERVLAARALSLVAQLLLVEAAVAAFTLIGVALIGHPLPVGRVAVAVLPGFLAETALAGTLAVFCLYVRDPTQAMLVTLVVALVLYFLPVLAPSGAVRFLSPFAYGAGSQLLLGGAFPVGHAVVLAVWTVVAFGLAVGLYGRSDA